MFRRGRRISEHPSFQQRELTALNRQGTQQQAYSNSTWHASKYTAHKLHQRYFLNDMLEKQAKIYGLQCYL